MMACQLIEVYLRSTSVRWGDRRRTVGHAQDVCQTPNDDGPNGFGCRRLHVDDEAALIAAEGDFDAATEHALGAARHAASLGQWATMAQAAHDAVRYTRSPEAARLLAAAAEQADGPLYPYLADYARARVDDDAAMLSSVSVRLEELGTILYAAEAAYAAARAYRTGGAGRAAAAAAVRASNLHARCEHAAIPWATGFQAGELLTRREEQVALMAAAGKPDAVIATDLQISIRTVQNHLTRAYRKLAVTGRHELPNALSHDDASAM